MTAIYKKAFKSKDGDLWVKYNERTTHTRTSPVVEWTEHLENATLFLLPPTPIRQLVRTGNVTPVNVLEERTVSIVL